MTVKELGGALKAGQYANVYLFYGEEAFLKEHYAKQVKAAFSGGPFDEFNVFAFDGRGYDTTAVENAIEALPMMADSKLLVFTDSRLFKPDPRTGADQAHRTYWEQRLKDIPSYCHILFVEQAIDKRSALYKTILKNHVVCEFAYLSLSELTSWTVKLFQTLGKRLSAMDAQHLIGLCDDGMLAVKREAEKLAAYTQGRADVTRADIDAVVVPTVKSQAFAMVDAWLAQNTDKALGLLNDLYALREPPLKILGAVNYQLDRLLSVKLLLADGLSRGEILSRLKLPPFLADRYIKNANAYPLAQLRSMLAACAKTDAALKNNSIDNNILLEMLIIQNKTK